MRFIEQYILNYIWNLVILNITVFLHETPHIEDIQKCLIHKCGKNAYDHGTIRKGMVLATAITLRNRPAI